MAKKNKKLRIAHTAAELLAQDRHTDWQIAHEAGKTRFGRAYLGHRVQGAGKTKAAKSRKACRGKVRY